MNELSQLHDIHLPSHVAIFPLAPVWYFILVCICALAVSFIKRYRAHVYHNLPKKQALKILNRIKDQPNQHAKLVQVALLLKRVAIHFHGRNRAARLSGEDWISFLNGTCHKSPLFSKQQSFLLTHMLYERKPHINETQINNLIEKTAQWIKQQ